MGVFTMREMRRERVLIGNLLQKTQKSNSNDSIHNGRIEGVIEVPLINFAEAVPRTSFRQSNRPVLPHGDRSVLPNLTVLRRDSDCHETLQFSLLPASSAVKNDKAEKAANNAA